MWLGTKRMERLALIESRRWKSKNLTALKSNSNTVWFNFQTYIYIYIYIRSLSYSGTLFTFYLLRFGKLVANQLTSCWKKISKRDNQGITVLFYDLIQLSRPHGLMWFFCRINIILKQWLRIQSLFVSKYTKKSERVYIYIYIYIYVWKLNQIVLELDFRAVKFLFFPRRDLNPHHCYTAAPFA
jgi:hypothetical protein